MIVNLVIWICLQWVCACCSYLRLFPPVQWISESVPNWTKQWEGETHSLELLTGQFPSMLPHSHYTASSFKSRAFWCILPRMAPEVIACDENPDATYDNRVCTCPVFPFPLSSVTFLILWCILAHLIEWFVVSGYHCYRDGWREASYVLPPPVRYLRDLQVN